MTDAQWFEAWARLHSKPDAVRVRYFRWCQWMMRNQPPEF